MQVAEKSAELRSADSRGRLSPHLFFFFFFLLILLPLLDLYFVMITGTVWS